MLLFLTYHPMWLCRTVILCVLFIGWETWSLRLREEHGLRVVRKMFGPKREKVTGGWRK